MAEVVFDSSAVVAFLRNEPGAATIARYCGQAIISAVNLQEVIKVLGQRGFNENSIRYMIDAMYLEVVPNSKEDAYQAAALFSSTSQYGSGLGDRTCMALAISKGFPAVTTDKAWANLSIDGLTVILAR